MYKIWLEHQLPENQSPRPLLPRSGMQGVSTLKWPDDQGTKPWAGGFEDMAVGRKHALAIYFPYPGRMMKVSESSGTHVCIGHWLFCGLQMLFSALLTVSTRQSPLPKAPLQQLSSACSGLALCLCGSVPRGGQLGVLPGACGVGTGPLRTCQREDHWSRVGTRQFPAGTVRSLCLFTAEVAAGRRNSRKGRRGGGSYGTQGTFVIFLICIVNLAYYPIERQGGGAFDF